MAHRRKSTRARTTPLVLVVLPLEYGYYRDVLHGIGKFVGERWRLFLSSGERVARSELVSPEGIDGFIAAVSWPHSASLFGALGVPGVNVSGRMEATGLPTVRPDDVAIGRLAAEHLLARGHTHFACVSQDTSFAARRAEGFAEAIVKAGLQRPVVLSRADDALDLRRPAALFTTADSVASHLIGMCQQASIRVPDDLAIVGVDNDQTLCTYTSPTLTSVDPAGDLVGFEAARLLERMMSRRKLLRDAPDLILPPRGIVARTSTDTLNVTDRELTEAVRFIRSQACSRIRVSDVAKCAALSRRTLERRFMKEFGHSVLDEVIRVQMERARELLVKTDLKMPAIADRCGYGNYRNFITRFKRISGVTPGHFRKVRRLS